MQTCPAASATNYSELASLRGTRMRFKHLPRACWEKSSFQIDHDAVHKNSKRKEEDAFFPSERKVSKTSYWRRSNWFVMNTLGGGLRGGDETKEMDNYLHNDFQALSWWAGDLRHSSWGLCLCPSQDRTMHRLVPGEPCPELDCAESEQIVLNDRCCKVCRGTGDPWQTRRPVPRYRC